jgi:chromosome segregation ATPase
MTDEELNRRFEQLHETLRDMEARRLESTRDMQAQILRGFEQSQESTRDMQTEILRGLERFARGNFSRMHRLEVSDNDLNERLNALEERITAIETRPPR